ncbi:hypothetical protein FQN60_009223 [Etheostoma spectabile]|uniref:Uncharacterized protein n=1 Tax=Etheostoma spectabile TaxID=54343 RepID=A0A5J5C9A8_9PERO|nr:hypothetical protein FQN60_009223 [Etheostoma spectabile]
MQGRVITHPFFLESQGAVFTMSSNWVSKHILALLIMSSVFAEGISAHVLRSRADEGPAELKLLFDPCLLKQHVTDDITITKVLLKRNTLGRSHGHQFACCSPRTNNPLTGPPPATDHLPPAPTHRHDEGQTCQDRFLPNTLSRTAVVLIARASTHEDVRNFLEKCRSTSGVESSDRQAVASLLTPPI